MDQIDEAEAMRLAVMFEETSKYERKMRKEREQEARSGSTGGGVGLKQGFEVDLEFGDEDGLEPEEGVQEQLYDTGQW